MVPQGGDLSLAATGPSIRRPPTLREYLEIALGASSTQFRGMRMCGEREEFRISRGSAIESDELHKAIGDFFALDGFEYDPDSEYFDGEVRRRSGPKSRAKDKDMAETVFTLTISYHGSEVLITTSRVRR